MTDLNAPLGQTGDRPESRRQPGRRDRLLRTPPLSAAAATVIFGALFALNGFSFFGRDSARTAAPITVAQAELPATDKATTSTLPAGNGAKTENGVKVVYGDKSNGESADAATAPDKRKKSAEADGRISEGGPKIITIRDPSAAAVGQPQEFAHLPDDDALQATDFGELPVITSDGRRPMDIYARPWSRNGGKRIAIVIGGLGLSQTGTFEALKKLPPEITLAFAPQGNSLNRWMEDARKKGHELLVQVPMEPFDYPRVDPGPQTLTVAATKDANLDNLHWALGQITNYTGVINYLGGQLMANSDAMAPILGDIARRGLLYLNDGTGGGNHLADLAKSEGVPYVTGDSVIDTTRDPKAIRARLKQLEDIASADGSAVGTGSAFETTVDVVSEWANEAKKRGFEIVGVSALAR